VRKRGSDVQLPATSQCRDNGLKDMSICVNGRGEVTTSRCCSPCNKRPENGLFPVVFVRTELVVPFHAYLFESHAS
jgi:hypothetical protein